MTRLVKKIFGDYLRLGSIGALAAALDREGVRAKPRMLANGTTMAAERFMVGRRTEPVSLGIEPVSVGADRKIPDIGKSRSETVARLARQKPGYRPFQD